MAHNKTLFCGSRRLGTSKKASAFSDVEQQRRRFCYHIIMRNFLFSFIVEKNFEEKFGPLCRGPSDAARIFITLQVSDPALMSNNKSADFSVFFKSFMSYFGENTLIRINISCLKIKSNNLNTYIFKKI